MLNCRRSIMKNLMRRMKWSRNVIIIRIENHNIYVTVEMLISNKVLCPCDFENKLYIQPFPRWLILFEFVSRKENGRGTTEKRRHRVKGMRNRETRGYSFYLSALRSVFLYSENINVAEWLLRISILFWSLQCCSSSPRAVRKAMELAKKMDNGKHFRRHET